MKHDLEHLRVVLVGTRNPLNIGAAARAMSNFGARSLGVVRPYEVAFREARSAVGAAEVLAKATEYATLNEAVADCRLVVGTTAGGRRELQHELRRLEIGARAIRRELKTGRVALLFGSEKVGLSNDDMSHCHWLIRIPARVEHGSMNLGQAVAVCLYELVRAGRNATDGEKATMAALPAHGSSGQNSSRKSSPGRGSKARKNSGARVAAAEAERLTQLLLEVLRISGYVQPRVAAATEEKLRRMVRRLNLSEADAQVWLGMMRQIQWRLEGSYERSRQ